MTFPELLAALFGATRDPSALALIGAAARNAWAPPRATTDLDLAVSASRDVLDSMKHALRLLGYVAVREQRVDPTDPLPDILIFRNDARAPRQIDLLIAKTDFEKEVLRRAADVDIGGAMARVATPEDLIVYKLIANRPRDRDDVRAVARTQARAGQALDWPHVERWSAYWGVLDRLMELRHDLER